MTRTLTMEDLDLITAALREAADSWQDQSEDDSHTMHFAAKLEGRARAAEKLAVEIMDGQADYGLLQAQHDALRRHSDRLEYILRELDRGGWLRAVPAALRREAENLTGNFTGMD